MLKHFIPHLFLNIGAENTDLLIRDGCLVIPIDAIRHPMECAIRYIGSLGNSRDMVVAKYTKSST